MQVASVVGLGTTFHLLLPTTTRDVVAKKQTKPLTNALQTGQILVVDDEPVIRMALAEVLELQGFDVLTAENGQVGLDLFADQRHALDLVVMDISMPVMSGRDALQEIRQQRADIPVILLSGFDPLDVANSLTQTGNVVFLHKPFSLQTLLTTVQRMLSKRQPV